MLADSDLLITHTFTFSVFGLINAKKFRSTDSLNSDDHMLFLDVTLIHSQLHLLRVKAKRNMCVVLGQSESEKVLTPFLIACPVDS